MLPFFIWVFLILQLTVKQATHRQAQSERSTDYCIEVNLDNEEKMVVIR